MKVLEFEILERKYQISCPDKEEEILKACVALVDSRMKSLKTQGKLHSTEKIAIMVALTLAKDFLKVGGANGDESNEKIVELPMSDYQLKIYELARQSERSENKRNALKKMKNAENRSFDGVC